MSDDHFNYDQLMLDAHRALIRQVLLKVAQTGLPGDHHFFIIFSTTHPETRVSDRLRVQYPSEMTIVLQHQYSNLRILEDRFEIQLSFNRIPELLVIPFHAITGFVDPSVPFGLQLAGDTTSGLENSIGMLVPGLPQPPPLETPGETVTTFDDYRADETPIKSEPVIELVESEETSVPSVFPAKPALHEVASDETPPAFPAKGLEAVENDEQEDEKSATVLQLDAFRKKTK